MRYERPFRDVIPRSKAGHPRVTHPFATLLIPCGTFAFDLHVLGTPPALILSQDQTLMLRTLSPRVPLARNATEKQLVNARPIYWLCVVQSVRLIVVHRQSPSHGLTTPVDRFRDATC